MSMDLGSAPTGSDPSQDFQSLLSLELEKLKDHKLKLKEENESYISKHPELRTILDSFIAQVILQQPLSIVKFGQQFFSGLRDPSMIGPCPLVFAGPSGVGKGTLINMLMRRLPGMFGFSVSHTTRQPRPGEEDGKHYHFLETREMEHGIANKEFIEYANVHTNIYGTSLRAVESVRSQGKICILDIDIQGVKNVKLSSLDCRYVFISPPSIETLEARLRGRGTETEEKIQVRMTNAQEELKYGHEEGNFDAMIINDDLEKSFRQIQETISNFYPDMDFSAAAEQVPEGQTSN